MNNAIKCYLVKPSGRSRYWKMRHQLSGQTKETQVSLKVRDQRSAQRMMEAFIMEEERIAAGILPSRKLREASNAKLESSLASYLAALQAEKCCANHISTRGYQIRRIAKEAGWITLRDIRAESFLNWQAQTKNLSPRTQNNYLADMRAFLNWLVMAGKLTENPLAHVRRVKAHEKARARRAITDDQIANLLAVAPDERRIIYLIALHTGLRRNEIALLEWQDVILDAESPIIKLRAITTKNRKGGEVSIHPELQSELVSLRENATGPCSRVVQMFKGLEPFKKDLEAAGIPFMDRTLRFDFHAMRKTFNTRMANGNVPTRAAMQAMRHSDEKLTTVDYTDPNRLNVAMHIASLPPLLGVAMVSARASGESESEGNVGPQDDTMKGLLLSLQATGNKIVSHTLTQCETLWLNWQKSSLTRIRT